jgi:hypothetical protein
MGYPYSTSTLYCRFIVNQGPNFGGRHAWKSDIISTWVQNLLDLCFLLYLMIMLWLKVWPCQYFSPATIFLKTGNLLNILIFRPSYIVCRDTCVPLVTICNISVNRSLLRSHVIPFYLLFDPWINSTWEKEDGTYL